MFLSSWVGTRACCDGQTLHITAVRSLHFTCSCNVLVWIYSIKRNRPLASKSDNFLSKLKPHAHFSQGRAVIISTSDTLAMEFHMVFIPAASLNYLLLK